MCVHIKYCMKYWKTDIHNIMSADCDYSNFSYLCVLLLCWPATLTYPRRCCLRKCLHYSDIIPVNVESIHFVSNSSPLSWCLVFFPALLFSAQFSSVLYPFWWVFFLHSISVTGTTSLFVNQNLADCDNPLILQALIANPSIFLYLFTELMGSCLQLWFLMFWALPYVSRLFLNII